MCLTAPDMVLLARVRISVFVHVDGKEEGGGGRGEGGGAARRNTRRISRSMGLLPRKAAVLRMHQVGLEAAHNVGGRGVRWSRELP